MASIRLCRACAYLLTALLSPSHNTVRHLRLQLKVTLSPIANLQNLDIVRSPVQLAHSRNNQQPLLFRKLFLRRR